MGNILSSFHKKCTILWTAYYSSRSYIARVTDMEWPAEKKPCSVVAGQFTFNPSTSGFLANCQPESL